ncbi:sushi domain-containing protein 3-like isoform X3 [Carassius auratus]|uniref:Sushi domain-containing protein 3-like isoform X3 n=1 Tax=Carassius auratus TaxID=7957 RepID=A0A6P6Q216_CARAU|nr:sushi domain-containing protein 3-like isoform X3 [Carassius auratus]
MAFTGASESVMGDWGSVHNQTGQCAPLLSPAVGTLKLVSGDGTSVGSVMSLQCPSRHRAVSGGQMTCVWGSDETHWSGGTPECKPLSRFEDNGFRLALLVSFISSAIILFMCIFFITSCLVRHVKREERRKMERCETDRIYTELSKPGKEKMERFANKWTVWSCRERVYTTRKPTTTTTTQEERDSTQTSSSTAMETSTLTAGVFRKGGHVL